MNGHSARRAPARRAPQKGAGPAKAGRARGEGNGVATGGDKRRRILEAAVRVFAEHGFYNARVADIAAAAGIAAAVAV